MTRRRAFYSMVGCMCVGAVSCILAEPPVELPKLPLTRPVIRRGSVVPSADAILGTFPSTLIVWVELSDPTLSFEWSAFIDYNPLTGDGLVFEPAKSTYEPGQLTSEGHGRSVTVPLPVPADLERCHVIEVVVALQFVSTQINGLNAHTPADPGGDSVTWFYAPGGDLRGCPTLDAGPDAPTVRPEEGGGR